MFLTSGPDLVVEVCRAGMIGNLSDGHDQSVRADRRDRLLLRRDPCPRRSDSGCIWWRADQAIRQPVASETPREAAGLEIPTAASTPSRASGTKARNSHLATSAAVSLVRPCEKPLALAMIPHAAAPTAYPILCIVGTAADAMVLSFSGAAATMILRDEGPGDAEAAALQHGAEQYQWYPSAGTA